MVTKRFLRIAAISAIINAVIFFAYSVINLVMFAIQQKAISPSQNNIVAFLVSNLKPILTGTHLLIFLSALFIYASFIKLSFHAKVKPLPYSSYLVIFAMLVLFLAMLASIFSFSALQFLANLGIQKIEAFVGLSFIIFGIALFSLKKSIKESLLSGIGILYMLQGISLISSLFLPLRLVDFTIAIRILEAVLLFSVAKSKA